MQVDHELDIERPTSVPLVMIRFIAAIMMHMNVEYKIRQGLNMMKYASLHDEKKFDRPAFAFFVGLMQFVTTLGIEIICVCFISMLNKIILCFVKYLAFG
jgi:hypothetical protein